jgi:hypothetical protein
MKYKVLRNCYGFQGRYWEKGQVVDLDPTSKPPEHFEPLEKPPKAGAPSKGKQAGNEPGSEGDGKGSADEAGAGAPKQGSKKK